jgi:deoxyribodipyrimidine photo-lyase
MFTTNYTEVIAQLNAIEPIKYAKTRNYINGAVTKLSPYISRGVINTKQVLEAVLAKGYKLYQIEKFVQELAWRDYYQQVWIAKQNEIDVDIKNVQAPVVTNELPSAIVQVNTGITAIDDSISTLYETGYMHNHLRMYLAGIICNVAQVHWLQPAKWMYYHLLDGDWASNALSWQWVAGTFSNKKYIANQENINKYCNTSQTNTFLDMPYDAFPIENIPVDLQKTQNIKLETLLPLQSDIVLDNFLPTYIYNSYNLDVNWQKGEKANRILLLEPSHFAKYPVSEKVLNFIIGLSKNIPNLQIIIDEFDTLITNLNTENIFYKEHPTTTHYKGNKVERDWITPLATGYYPSFFSYWKKVEKQLKKQYA